MIKIICLIKRNIHMRAVDFDQVSSKDLNSFSVEVPGENKIWKTWIHFGLNHTNKRVFPCLIVTEI